MKTLIERERWARDVAGLSQQKLSTLAGLSITYVAHLESGHIKSPKTESLAGICSVLGVSLDWMAGGIGSRPTKAVIREAAKTAIGAA